MKLQAIIDYLESFAPSALAESWDNVGLLVGDARQSVARVMTCLTITPASAQESIRQRADLIVAHHPLPFRPLKRLTRATVEGGLLLDLIAAGVAIYSPHTAFDSARQGINQQLAEGLRLDAIAPLLPSVAGAAELGSGRWGTLSAATTVAKVAEQLKTFLKIDRLQYAGDLARPVERVAVACGSAGEFLEAARALDCGCFITGETNFHTALAAEASQTTLLLVGHFASERFGVERLAETIAKEFPDLAVWASRDERDPLHHF